MRDIQSTSQSFIREMERAADDAEFREATARMESVPRVAEPATGPTPEGSAIDAEAAVARSAAVSVDSDPPVAPAASSLEPAARSVEDAEISPGAPPLTEPAGAAVSPEGGASKPGSEV